MTPREERLDRYLNELSWAMGGPFAEQQAARDELRAHIRDAAREHELSGLSPDDALLAAFRDFGAPSEIGRALRSSRGTEALRRRLVLPEGALVLERRRIRNLPHPVIILGFVMAAFMVVGSIAAVLWP